MKQITHGRVRVGPCQITHTSRVPQSSIAVTGNVLRFQSDEGMTYDLEDWPDAWTEMNETALVALLRIAIATAHLPADLSASGVPLSGPSVPLRVLDAWASANRANYGGNCGSNYVTFAATLST